MENLQKKIAPWLFLISIIGIVLLDHFDPINNPALVRVINIIALFAMLMSIRLNGGVDKKIIASGVLGLFAILILEYFF